MTETISAPYLEMREITKTFPGVKALDGVTFDLHHGESMRWLGKRCGQIYPDEDSGRVYPYPEYGGEIRINGAVHRFSGIRDAEAAGVA